MSPAESDGLNRNSFVLPLTSISRRFILSAGMFLDDIFRQSSPQASAATLRWLPNDDVRLYWCTRTHPPRLPIPGLRLCKFTSRISPAAKFRCKLHHQPAANCYCCCCSATVAVSIDVILAHTLPPSTHTLTPSNFTAPCTFSVVVALPRQQKQMHLLLARIG